MRISRKLGCKRDNPRLFRGKGNMKEESKLVGGKKREET